MSNDKGNLNSEAQRAGELSTSNHALLLAQQRDAEMSSGTVRLMTHEELMARLREEV